MFLRLIWFQNPHVFVCLILFQDLKNLRKQLYAAAEYFELSYTNDDQKRLVVDTIKDYAIKALVNTVDHLGAVSCKLNDMLGQNVNEFSQTELRVSCIQQRLGTSQRCFDHEGLAEQSAIINTPKYHQRYILPVGETMQGGIRTKSKYGGCSLEDKDDWHEFKNGKKIQSFKMIIYNKMCLWVCFAYAAVRAKTRETPPSSFRKGRSPSPSTQQPGSFAFAGAGTPKDFDKRSVSPLRFPLLRTGSLSSRPTTPSSRPKTPNLSRQRVPQYQKSVSMRVYSHRDTHRETDQPPNKSKRLLKALLGRRKSKKDDMLFTYLDEY
ncbi:protein ABIL2-like isoform X1 [Bidens hawaiensis]|uniref:protein ABIL2-like isoform X1 n=1 Tax=Bidens hawaiensis TaxID=980011 RepID=UPI00404B8D5D